MIRRCRHRIWVSFCCYGIIQITRSVFNSSFISGLQTATVFGHTQVHRARDEYHERIPIETLQHRGIRKIIREKKKIKETVIVIEQRLLAETNGLAKASFYSAITLKRYKRSRSVTMIMNVDRSHSFARSKRGK
jgi:hypothetical protein